MEKNILGQPITQGVSVVTGIKNRSEHLLESLPTWLKNKNVNEVVIVDWSSDSSIVPIINNFAQNHKIVLIRVNNESKWILSHAYNLGIKCTSKNKVLKLDSDIKLTDNFFKNCVLTNKAFLTGRWELARNKNESHLNGSIYAYRNDLISVHGYDERITSYGWDDTDLYHRLEKKGLSRNNIHPDNLSHIPHDDLLRIKHQEIDPEYKKNIQNLIIKHMDLTTSRTSWGSDKINHAHTEFNIEKQNKNYFICQRKPSKLYVYVRGTIEERIRDYFVAKYISEDINKELILVWEPNESCDYTFSHFFTNNINVQDRFKPEIYKPDTRFYFLNNVNFENQNIVLNAKEDIVISSKRGFSYENDVITPLTKLNGPLKRYIKNNFKDLKPKKSNSVFFKNLLDDVLNIKSVKAHNILKKEEKNILINKVYNYKNAVSIIRTNLTSYIKQNSVKSLVLGIHGVNSVVCAALIKPVCNELNIPLIGIYINNNTSKDINLINSIGSVFCNEFKKIDLGMNHKKHLNNNKSVEKRFINNFVLSYLNSFAQLNDGIVVSTKDQLSSMLGFYDDVSNSNTLNMLTSLYKTEVNRMCTFLANKDNKKSREKQILHKILKIQNTEFFKSLNVDSYTQLENILKEFLNGNTSHKNHPAVRRYIITTKEASLVKRSDLVD